MKDVTIILNEGHYESEPGKRSPVSDDGK